MGGTRLCPHRQATVITLSIPFSPIRQFQLPPSDSTWRKKGKTCKAVRAGQILKLRPLRIRDKNLRSEFDRIGTMLVF